MTEPDATLSDNPTMRIRDLLRGNTHAGNVHIRVPTTVRDLEFPPLVSGWITFPGVSTGILNSLVPTALRRRRVFQDCRFVGWRTEWFDAGLCDFRNCDFVDCVLAMDSQQATYSDCRFTGSRLRGGISAEAAFPALSTTAWLNNDVSKADAGSPSLLFGNIDLSSTVIDPSRQAILNRPGDPALLEAVAIVDRRHPDMGKEMKKATDLVGVGDETNWVGPQLLQARGLRNKKVSLGRQLYCEIVTEYITLTTR